MQMRLESMLLNELFFCTFPFWMVADSQSKGVWVYGFQRGRNTAVSPVGGHPLNGHTKWVR
jgi:hypothetical protein